MSRSRLIGDLPADGSLGKEGEEEGKSRERRGEERRGDSTFSNSGNHKLTSILRAEQSIELV